MVKECILGVSAFYHDSAAALLQDGDIVAAAHEERFSRIKGDPSFPIHAIDFCLRQANTTIEKVNKIVFYEKPFLKLERILETHLACAPYGVSTFLTSMPYLISGKLNIKSLILRQIYKKYGVKFSRKDIVFSNHHLSHAASSFYTSPFTESASLTIDGVGEWASLSISKFTTDRVEVIKEMHFPDSLGLFYSSFTYFCGFRVNFGEYKLMGLSSFGRKDSVEALKYISILKKNFIEVFDDGSIKLNMKYFSYDKKNSMLNIQRVEQVLGIKRRNPSEEIGQVYCDLAYAVQTVLEESILKLCSTVQKLTGSKNLCFSGGVALNCVANSKILNSEIFDNVWIQPAANDSGGALGAALAYFYSNNSFVKKQEEFSPYLGAGYSQKECEEALERRNIKYSIYNDEDLLTVVTTYLSSSKVVGWFQGRAEWGPRALGNRSILADPRDPEMQSNLNMKVKFRESFRPFAPVVLYDKAGQYFEKCVKSPYMLYTYKVLKIHLLNRLKLKEPSDPLDRIRLVRSVIPAVTHVDGTARVQTVDKKFNRKLYCLIEKFYQKTNVPMLINTSFNVRDEPIVNSPDHAIDCFLTTGIDVLVLCNLVILKGEM